MDSKPKTEAETYCEIQTKAHIAKVAGFMNTLVVDLINRAVNHDASKLSDPEFPVFCKYTPLLKSSVYGSADYKQLLSEMAPALEHHYANNTHHPENHKDGWRDMNLMDLLEMVCDWMAAVQRHDNGSIKESLAINKKRFGLSDDIVKILESTINYITNLQAFESIEGKLPE